MTIRIEVIEQLSALDTERFILFGFTQQSYFLDFVESLLIVK